MGQVNTLSVLLKMFMDSIYMRFVRTDLLEQKDVEGARGVRQPQAAPSVVEQQSERHVQR